MTQHQILIDFLRSNPTGVTTADFVRHFKLCAEYRARISEARKKGFVITAEKISKNLYRYRLIAEPDGEFTFCKPKSFIDFKNEVSDGERGGLTAAPEVL